MTDTALIGPVEPPDLQVMTFNIRRPVSHMNRRSPDRWSRRKSLVKRLLDSERPALLGMQEAMPDQVEFVAAALGNGYRWIGYGRKSDRSGEHCPIFYDAGRLELLDWDQQALSDTPGKPGSMTWGNWVPRVLVRATFTDKATGKEFVGVYTHLDHLSPKSRLRSAKAIKQLVSAAERPAVVMGDFNSDAGSKPHRELTGDGTLHDSWIVARERVTEPWGTFPNYRRPQREKKRIDWILTSPGIGVGKTGINITRYADAWPSDHTPVQAVVTINDDTTS